MLGFVNLNKPYNWTSHDCVAKTRKLLQIKRVGHAGTLDPAAVGTLPIAVGKATRLLQYLPTGKAYKATVRLGVRTTTDDLQGEIITQNPVNNLSFESVKTALSQFQGKIEQIPPNYSAIQVGGKRLYDLARQGKTIEVPSRTVEIFNIEILEWREGEFPELDLNIACGGGTYIRAIARDLGEVLGTSGTLAALQRTESSGFTLANSITFAELEAQLQAGNFQLISPDTALEYLPKLILDAILAKKWCQGQRISLSSQDLKPENLKPKNLNPENLNPENLNTQISGNVRIYHENGQFLGIGESRDNLLIPRMVLESL